MSPPTEQNAGKGREMESGLGLHWKWEYRNRVSQQGYYTEASIKSEKYNLYMYCFESYIYLWQSYLFIYTSWLFLDKHATAADLAELFTRLVYDWKLHFVYFYFGITNPAMCAAEMGDEMKRKREEHKSSSRRIFVLLLF